MSYFIYTKDKEDEEKFIPTILMHNLKGHKKILKLTYHEGKGTNWYDVTEYWTDETRKELGDRGYKKADGFMDRLAYSFTKCYVKLEGFNEAEPPD